MNPQFIRNIADRNAVRNEYIKNLQLETTNNLTNYNANQIFKQTGALPPSITSQLDTRSITEKYADIQKARVAVISQLKEITDGTNASSILDSIHGNEIITLLNNLPQIITDIKPKWSLGITAPAFLAYWNNYKQALTANSGLTSFPIFQSNQLLTSIEGLLQNIKATTPLPEDYDKLLNIVNGLPNTQLRESTKKAVLEARRANDILKQQAEALERNQQVDPQVKDNLRKTLQQLLDNLPTKDNIENFIQEGQIATNLGSDRKGIEDLENRMLGLLKPIQEVEEEEETIIEPYSARPSATESSTEESSVITTNAAESPNELRPKNFKELLNSASNNWIRFSIPFIKNLLETGEIDKNEIELNGVQESEMLKKKNIIKTNLPELINRALEKKVSGKGFKKHIKGCGISGRQSHPRLPSAISNYAKVDTSKKVERIPSYIQFGKHLLHQYDLHNGKLKIKRLSGTIINDLPTQAIGGKLKKVLITLTGTGNPSFEDINELSENEKSLLNKVVKHCKIDQRLLVPTPDKTKEEQAYNRLQILSGEITSGNNAPQIVKELKTLLLKLKNVGRIPARHANEILSDLLSLGF